MNRKLMIGGFIVAVICIAGYIWSQRIQKEVEMTDAQYDYYNAYCLTLEDANREKILSMSTEVGSREIGEQTVVEYRSGELMNYLDYCSSELFIEDYDEFVNITYTSDDQKGILLSYDDEGFLYLVTYDPDEDAMIYLKNDKGTIVKNYTNSIGKIVEIG